MEIYRSVDEMAWIPHPTANDVMIKPLITKNDSGLDVTCMLVRVPTGKTVSEHIHDEQDDILYLLEGRAVMWIEGTGDVPLKPGVIVQVPKGTKHKIFDVSEDLLIYDVFCPALM